MQKQNDQNALNNQRPQTLPNKSSTPGTMAKGGRVALGRSKLHHPKFLKSQALNPQILSTTTQNEHAPPTPRFRNL